MVIIVKKSSNKEEIEKLLSEITTVKQFDASKYAGKIKLIENPVKIQKKLRDEWE